MKYKECEFCEGKGYTQLQACYDEVQSREKCFECSGCGYIYEDDKESEEE
tara:strand:+ start:374 stop:523 length:150 start_codon:yes stop_codon:yes gene_type:complete